MVYQKRLRTVRVVVRMEEGLQFDLKILYGVAKKRIKEGKWEWEKEGSFAFNDFLVKVFSEYVSFHSGSVLRVRDELERLTAGVEKEKRV